MFFKGLPQDLETLLRGRRRTVCHVLESHGSECRAGHGLSSCLPSCGRNDSSCHNVPWRQKYCPTCWETSLADHFEDTGDNNQIVSHTSIINNTGSARHGAWLLYTYSASGFVETIERTGLVVVALHVISLLRQRRCLPANTLMVESLGGDRILEEPA